MSNSIPDPDEYLKNFIRCQRDPWFFLSNGVFTQDQVDMENPIKRYPADWDYLYLMTRLWEQNKLMAVPKSRRMTASWTFLPLQLWLALFKPGMHCAVVSKKEDDSAELLARIEFVYKHIPESFLPKELLPKLKNGRMSKSPPVMEFDNGSVIRGTAMGADQLRQFTFSSIFGDECAFWENAEKFYAAAKPTIDGGGRMALVSSRSPGFFKKIVFDQIDNPTYNFAEVAPVVIKTPMQGVEVWKNPKNKFLVFDLHYSANPVKRSEEWRNAVKDSMPIREYMREYEKSWQTFEGLPVYGDFRKDIHVSPTRIDPEPGLPLIIGHDFGMSAAAVVCQLVGNQLRILKEFIGMNEGTKTFVPKVMGWITQTWPAFHDNDTHFIHAIDPAGFNRNPTDATTCANTMRVAAGCKQIKPGPMLFEPRKNAVEHFLLHIDREGPGLLISEKECPLIVEGFAGGYRYPDKAIDIEPNNLRPLKDNYSHPHDALQYAAHIARQGKRTGQQVSIPSPSYGFGNDTTTSTNEIPQHRRRELGQII